MKYIKGIDTLRAFAIICVIIYHWVNFHPHLLTFNALFRLFLIPDGAFGVNLFFVISGFLITTILLEAREKGHNYFLILKVFIIRRALRIFPIYYLLIIFLLVTGYPFEPGSLIYFLTYTSNFWVMKVLQYKHFAHAWSLAVEEQFYVIWPWVILFTNKLKLKYIILFFILLGPLSDVFIVHVLKSGWYSPFTFSCFDAFGIGGLYAWLRQNKRYDTISRLIRITLPASVAIYLSWKVCMLLGVRPNAYYFSRTIDSLISIGLIHMVIVNKSEFARKYIFENPVFTFIGKISYGIYLVHGVISYYFGKYILDRLSWIPSMGTRFTSSTLQLLCMFLLVVGVCYLSYTFIEKPIMNLKRKFKYSEGG